jgi:hypothetical protein
MIKYAWENKALFAIGEDTGISPFSRRREKSRG